MQVQTKALKEELAWCQRFIEKKTTIPILSNVLFDVAGGKLTLTSTDLEVAGATSISGAGRDAWSGAFPVAKLIQYLGKVDEPEVTLSVDGVNALSVKHGNNSTKVSGMSKESYPELPAAPRAVVTLGRLALAIGRVAFAISSEETRFTLNGALLEVDEDEARLISTDGHRLSSCPVQARGTVKLNALIRKKALLEVARFEDDCQFSANDDHQFFTCGARRITSRKLTGNFPDYRRVMPDEHPNHVMIPVAATLKTLDRVALYADERSRAVRFTIKDNVLNLYANSGDTGEANGDVMVRPGEITITECAPCEGTGKVIDEECKRCEGTGKRGDKPLLMGLNADYVTDFLSRTDYQFVAFCWKDERSMAMLATGDGWQYGVMPMRI